MNEIKRYFFEIGYEAYFPYIHREENEDGDYVLYSDHKQALAQKETECAELRAIINKHDIGDDGEWPSYAELALTYTETANKLTKAEAEMNRLDMIISDYGVAEYIKKLETEISELRERVINLDSDRVGLANGFVALEKENANLTRQLNEPIHLGMFYNEEEGIKNIYILDKDGNETDRVVKAECLLKRIAGYFNRAKKAEAQLEEKRVAIEKLNGLIKDKNIAAKLAMVMIADLKAHNERLSKIIKKEQRGIMTELCPVCGYYCTGKTVYCTPPIERVVKICKLRQLDDDDYTTKPCTSDIYEKAIIELEAQLEEARKALAPIKEVYRKFKDFSSPMKEIVLEDIWNAIKQAALAGKEK